MKRKGLSREALDKLGWVILAVCAVAGIVLGFIFRTPDNDVNGRPIMVFDFGLMFSVWLAGGIGKLLCIARATTKK